MTEKTATSPIRVDLLTLLPRRKVIGAFNSLCLQATVLVPVTVNNDDKSAIYIEGRDEILTCRTFLSENEANEYLDMISVNSNIDGEDLKFCELPLPKLIASLSAVSHKAQRPIRCLTMIRHEGKYYDIGILWTNHEPLMV